MIHKDHRKNDSAAIWKLEKPSGFLRLNFRVHVIPRPYPHFYYRISSQRWLKVNAKLLLKHDILVQSSETTDHKLTILIFSEIYSLPNVRKLPFFTILQKLFYQENDVNLRKPAKFCERRETGVKTGIEPVMKAVWLWFSLRFTLFCQFSAIRSKFGEITIWL